MTIAVDTVATDADIESEVAGTSALRDLLPEGWTTAKPAREIALTETLRELSRRTPPILEADLIEVTDLRDSVIYGALARLYRAAIQVDGDRYWHLARHYEKAYANERRTVRPTLQDGQSAHPHTITMHRR